MTRAQLEELKKLCAGATPGPWGFTESSKPALLEDAEFISAARSAVPELIAEVERLRGLVKRAEWEGDDGLNASCPWCRAQRFEWREQNPHDADCDAFTPNGEVR